MKNNFVLIFIILFYLVSLPAIICAQGEQGSADLISHSREYDAKPVIYTGELIGEIMRRGEFAWVNLSDGENSLGVWVNAALIQDINFKGSYKTRGDILEVAGIFHRACPEHGGDLDIHAQSLRKVASGRAIKEKLHSDKVTLSIILLGALLLIWILMLFKHK
jgi:hypothetical protein